MASVKMETCHMGRILQQQLRGNNDYADPLAGARMKGGSHHCQSAAEAAEAVGLLQDVPLQQRQQRKLINEQAMNLRHKC